MMMSKRTRQYIGILSAIVAYYIVHEGAHLIVALALHAFKKINFMGIGIQIDIYRDRLTDTQLGIFCIAGKKQSYWRTTKWRSASTTSRTDFGMSCKGTIICPVWNCRRKKQYRKVRYYNLLTSGKLNGYLANLDQQAEEMFSRLVKQLAEKEGVTEAIKAENQMLWVQKMNSIRNAAMEIISNDLIYA